MSEATPTPESVRAEVNAWIAEHWDPTLSLQAWRELLVDSGWGAPSWERRWHGRGLLRWANQIVASELASADAVGMPAGGGMSLAAPTIHAHGPDELREQFLRRTLTGEYTWCQLFSEPGAGSDLAGLTTHAVLDGDRWIANGQKVWNTSAHHADFGILVARTNWDVPKHRGLTYFVLPMHQPGVEVRPLKQMNHHASFNEVFMSDAVIPREHVVGDVGSGWAVAMTTLAFERNFGGVSRPRRSVGGGLARTEADHEAKEFFETYQWYPQRAGRVDLVVEHARQRAMSSDPVVRHEIATLLSVQRVSGWTAERGAAARALGRAPGAEGSLGKLSLSIVARRAAGVHSLIGGATGMLDGDTAPFGGMIAEVLVSVPGQSIAGGTDEIQHNILGEKILGLAREPAPDKDLPFRDLPRN